MNSVEKSLKQFLFFFFFKSIFLSLVKGRTPCFLFTIFGSSIPFHKFAWNFLISSFHHFLGRLSLFSGLASILSTLLNDLSLVTTIEHMSNLPSFALFCHLYNIYHLCYIMYYKNVLPLINEANLYQASVIRFLLYLDNSILRYFCRGSCLIHLCCTYS